MYGIILDGKLHLNYLNGFLQHKRWLVRSPESGSD